MNLNVTCGQGAQICEVILNLKVYCLLIYVLWIGIIIQRLKEHVYIGCVFRVGSAGIQASLSVCGTG